jgi:hypothetical protein
VEFKLELTAPLSEASTWQLPQPTFVQTTFPAVTDGLLAAVVVGVDAVVAGVVVTRTVVVGVVTTGVVVTGRDSAALTVSRPLMPRAASAGVERYSNRPAFANETTSVAD